MPSELVKVIVRCRPRNEKEEKLKCQVRTKCLETVFGGLLVNNRMMDMWRRKKFIKRRLRIKRVGLLCLS